MFISTILEMVGLGFIFSIVGALNSTEIKNNIFLDKFINFFEINQNEIFLYLLIVFLTFYVVKLYFYPFIIGLKVIFFTCLEKCYLAKYLKIS